MKYLKWAGIAVALVGLFSLYSILPIRALFAPSAIRDSSAKFDTPDESINYFFATHVTKTGSIAYAEPQNAEFTNPIIFMRWMQSPGVGSALLYPGTFLGFILIAGAVAKLFGSGAILFLTPLFAVGSVLLMYWGVRQLFRVQVAVWSAIVLALLPPFFYYSSRTMFHTVSFLFFLLLGIAAYLRARNNSRSKAAGWFFVVLSAFGFGGALFIRLADVWWVGVIVLALLIARPMGWRKSAVFLLAVTSSIVGTLAIYRAVYGSWLTFGYPIPGFSASSATTGASQLGRFVLPFGFYPTLIWHAFVEALWRPYSGVLIMATLGFVAIAIRYWTEHRRAVVVAGSALLSTTLYVLCFYGSWSFSDSPTPGLVTIGSSYTRYFLPILVLVVPFVGFLVATGIRFLKTTIMRVGASVFMVLLFGAWAWSLAYASDEGLAHVAQQTKSYQVLVKELQKKGATRDDLFLVRRGEDKILFPDFPRVINVDYLPEEMVKKNVENYRGTVWVSSGDHVFKKQNPFRK